MNNKKFFRTYLELVDTIHASFKTHRTLPDLITIFLNIPWEALKLSKDLVLEKFLKTLKDCFRRAQSSLHLVKTYFRPLVLFHYDFRHFSHLFTIPGNSLRL